MSSERPPRAGSSAGKSGGRPPSKPPTRSGGKPTGKPPARSGGKPPEKSSDRSSAPRSTSSRPPTKSSDRSDYKPRADRPSSDRPKSDYKARTDRPSSDRPRSDKPKSDYKPRSERSSSDRPKSDYKARTDRPSSDRPRSDRPRSDKPRSDYKPTGGSSRPDQRPRRDDDRPDTRRPDRNGADRPRDPNLPDEIRADQLDIGVGHELRTLPEGLAEIVARHLVAADLALVDENIPLARQHIAAAKRRAGRVAAVREAAGITAYLAGEYAEAISELRTVRRMTGSNEYLPMMADSERGLGRPQRALELIKEVDARTLDPDTRVELLLVSAGARADLGQLDAALVVLQVPELRNLPRGATRARMQYAYADLLERVGRFEDAHEWMRQAAESDVDGVTDAAERLEEEAGVSFSEESFGSDEESDDEMVPLDGEGNPQA